MNNYISGRSITRRDSPLINQYLKELSSYPVMDREEQQRLFLELEKDPENKDIKHQLFLGNMRFVITIAKQYDNKGIPLEDIISTGNFGLLEAIEHYDPHKGEAFTTYAAYWIRKKILEDLDTSKLHVRLPDNKNKKINKAIKAIERFLQENEREPNDVELAVEMNISAEDAKDILKLLQYQNATNTVEEEGETLSIFDTLVGAEPNYDADFIHDILKKTLTAKEYRIIKTFYFSNSDKQQELADEYGITLRRLIQIKEGILEKLKKSSELYEYYNG